MPAEMSGLRTQEALVDGELLGQLLSYVERRRREAQRRFDQFARRRAAMSRDERGLAREALRAEAADIRGELGRLNLARSLIPMLLAPSPPGKREREIGLRPTC